MKKLYDTYQYLLNEHRQEQEIIAGVFGKATLEIKRAFGVHVSTRSVEKYETLLSGEERGVVE